ncbi:MAG: DUF177 domain-containing protein [Prevotella sp.]|nr:DUF177 domain-containing protein [Prevotella sp.]
MCCLEQFKIDLKGLTEELTPLEYSLDDQFFQSIDSTLVQGGSLHVSGSIRKAVGFFELLLHTDGFVRIPCDRCLDLMEQPIETDQRLVVKLGSEAQETDDVIIVDEKEALLDTAWLIYESIALAVPIQHVHQPGDCNDAMMRMLEEHSAARSSDADAQTTVDPRWEKLKGLKLDN